MMVDEGEYQQTFNEVNHTPCIFGRAMLANQCRCQHGQRLFIAEREAMSCLDTVANKRCRTYLNKLKEIARFTLKLPDLKGPLPHAQALRLQCGSLRGIRAALEQQTTIEDSVISNVAPLLVAIEAQPDLLQNPLILQAIVAFKGRKRRKR